VLSAGRLAKGALAVGLAVVLGSCGGPRAAPTSANRVEVAAAVDAPQIVALVNHSAPSGDLIGSYFCAGVLVGPAAVLTAAHCLADRVPAHVDAVVGADNLCRTAPVTGTRIRVQGVQGFADRDLALIRLRTSAPVPALTTADVTASPLVAVGWGRRSETGSSPCRKQGVAVAPEDPRACAALFADSTPRSTDWICARPLADQTRNTCTGDSGGPLLAPDGSGGWQLVGITSFGRDCRPTSVGVYAVATGFGDDPSPDPAPGRHPS
jgi:secreted trypsin-like serine protease